MILPDALADEVMTITHFRLMARHFGTTPALRDAILANTGVTADRLDRALTVPIAAQLQQIDNLNRLCAPGWFLDVREQLHFSAHGAITVAAQAAPTVADSLAIVANFLEVRLPIQRARLQRGDGYADLSLELAPGVDIPLDIIRPITFISLISVGSLVSSIVAMPPDGAQFLFTGPRPDYAAKLEAAIGLPVRFGASADSLRIPSAWLEIPSVFAEASLYAAALAQLNALAAERRRPPRGLRYRVEQLLVEQSAGRMDADACARALGLSRRTMTRRLADENTGFRQLLDADLRRRALALMETGGLTNARIADLLGYQNPASFHRAMQRWQRPEG